MLFVGLDNSVDTFFFSSFLCNRAQITLAVVSNLDVAGAAQSVDVHEDGGGCGLWNVPKCLASRKLDWVSGYMTRRDESKRVFADDSGPS
jgi:hypothetical protein